MSGERDRELGMHRKITRRDFLDGTAMAIGGVALGSHTFGKQSAEGALPAYPPALTGLRGDQDKGFEYAHKLRDGKSWEAFCAVEEEHQSYELIVVGAGINR